MDHKFAGHKLQQQRPMGQTVTRRTGDVSSETSRCQSKDWHEAEGPFTPITGEYNTSNGCSFPGGWAGRGSCEAEHFYSNERALLEG